MSGCLLLHVPKNGEMGQNLISWSDGKRKWGWGRRRESFSLCGKFNLRKCSSSKKLKYIEWKTFLRYFGVWNVAACEGMSFPSFWPVQQTTHKCLHDFITQIPIWNLNFKIEMLWNFVEFPQNLNKLNVNENYDSKFQIQKIAPSYIVLDYSCVARIW